jgi:DNA-binding NtrC family response regulator
VSGSCEELFARAGLCEQESAAPKRDLAGNVRELRNVLERAVILADRPVIEPTHLLIEAGPPLADAPGGSVREGSLAELERRTIERTLEAVNGNRRRTAAKLGMGLRTRYVKLKRYDAR